MSQHESEHGHGCGHHAHHTDTTDKAAATNGVETGAGESHGSGPQPGGATGVVKTSSTGDASPAAGQASGENKRKSCCCG